MFRRGRDAVFGQDLVVLSEELTAALEYVYTAVGQKENQDEYQAWRRSISMLALTHGLYEGDLRSVMTFGGTSKGMCKQLIAAGVDEAVILSIFELTLGQCYLRG